MEKQKSKIPTEKILNLNGKEISLVLAEGQWWVAIKPVCDILTINFEKQRERLNRSKLLGQLPTKQGVVAADGKVREMLCLPERYVYGWLASINSDSEELLEYQKECYDVLFNHFHGRFTKLVEKFRIEAEMEEVAQKLAANEDFQKYQNLLEQKKQIPISLKRMDNDLLKGQIRFDFDSQ
jgi:hypothetical protein